MPIARYLKPRPADHRALPIFLRLFFVISAAFFVVWQASVYFDVLLDRHQRIDTTSEATRRGRELLADSLRTHTEDLKILSRGQDLRRLAAGDSGALEAVATNFETFVSEKPTLTQLRYISRRGQEIVRIDRKGGAVIRVGADALQDKGDRYYFRQSIELAPGEIYFSPIDLNVEHGAVEMPWNPTLRLATPVQGTDGTAAGIVIINIAAAELIAGIERDAPAASAPIQLLDRNGYWLAGVPRDRLWGFMFGRDTTMEKIAPGIWRRVVSSDKGSFDEAGSHYVFQTLQPGRPASRGSASTLTPDAIQWKILGVVPPISLQDLWRNENPVSALAGLLIVAIVCIGWTRTVVARRSAEATQKAGQEELIRVERMASLGSLVAGVAHELNTPIGNAVVLASSLADKAADLDAMVTAGPLKRSTLDAFVEDMGEGTRLILHGLERTAELLGHFKQVAIDQTNEQHRVFQLNDLVSDVVSALEPQFKHSDVKLVIGKSTKTELTSYPGPLGQVLLNLIINARIHGFDDGGSGTVEVITKEPTSSEVEIVIRDNGKGILPDVQRRIFEPFFTTSLGKGGNGLGLSIVLNIVTDVLGGTIRVESEPGAGTSMIVRIPRRVSAVTVNRLGRAHDAEHRSRT